MKLKEFLDNINNMVAKDKTLLDLDVITSKDDEGNGFNLVYFEPTLGRFYDGNEFDQYNEEDADDEDLILFCNSSEINAICVN